jgi:Fe-S-cluster containining protein
MTGPFRLKGNGPFCLIDREDVIGSHVKGLRTHCIRCGECCLRSSPTLQAEDLHLIKETVLEKKNLITLRKGELVTDIVKNAVEPSVDEAIKIKENQGTERGCLFYDGASKTCGIYDARPLQCTALQCWDNREILEVLGRPKLRRRDVISDGVLLGLMEAHENRCSYTVVEDHVRRISTEGSRAVEGLLDLLKFDFHLRPFVSQKLNIPVDEMDFFFGRPLVETIRRFGLQVIKEQDGSFFLTRVRAEGNNGMLE